jgi:cell wall-associated NlpC family hydrolase
MDWDIYIGIPFTWQGREFTGVDCYGLVCLIYEGRGICLPDYAYCEQPNLPPLFSAGLCEPCWHKVHKPLPYDVVVFKINGHPLHCGIVIDDTRFIHCREGMNTCIERLDGPNWRNRIWGIYRHAR